MVVVIGNLFDLDGQHIEFVFALELSGIKASDTHCGYARGVHPKPNHKRPQYQS
jgi:hypothetical protein